MAIVSCKKIGAGRNGDNTKDRHRSYTVVFRVIVNSPADGPATVVGASGIPNLYVPYVGYESTPDSQALCTGVKPEQDGDEWQRWRVTCTFTTNWAEGNNPNQQQNPEDEPAVFWVETEFATKAITKDYNGQDIRNSAGQLMAGLERFDAVETWVWEKNFTSLNRGTWKSYQNTVNSDSVGEIEPKQGLLHIIVPKPSFRDGQPYWRVQFRVKINPDKWTQKPADRGTAVLSGEESDSADKRKLQRPKDEMDQPIDGEVFLDGHGKMITDPLNTEIHYIEEKDVYRPMNFSALGVFT